MFKMKKYFFRWPLPLILIIFFSCRGDQNPCKLSEAILKDIAQTDSLIKLPQVRERDSTWNFNNYREPSLITAPSETYRFTWHSSFDGVKIYRVEKLTDKYKAVIKTFGDRDTVPDTREFFISAKIWNDVIDRLSINGFWTYPSAIDRNGLDGATWILEGYKPTSNECTGKNYHRLTRWSPNDSTFIAMCDLFNSLTKE
jgi:hypothetical protein